MMMAATKRARVARVMVKTTRVAGNKEDEGDKEDDGIGNEGSVGQRGCVCVCVCVCFWPPVMTRLL